MKKFLFLFMLLGVMVSCTDKKGTIEALLDAGYHPITIGGYGWFKGAEKDFFVTKFKAYSPDSSRTVSGVVCKGLFFKGKTIRLD